MSVKLPTYFLSHGGGPWPWMMDQMPGVFDELKRSLAAIPSQLPEKPQAILVVTSHWVDRDFAVSGSPKPRMIYDYGGFPAHTYDIEYPAPGSPELARRVYGLLQDAGLPTRIDAERGFDHGTYTVTYPMYPDADVPVLQLSVRRGYDPGAHLELGRALRPLRSDGVLVLASGLSFHNLGLFGPEGAAASKAFDRWLQETMAMEPAARRERLTQWSSAPAARMCHPREDHLIPLMVACGAAEDERAALAYHEDHFMGGLAVSSFRFG